MVEINMMFHILWYPVVCETSTFRLCLALCDSIAPRSLWLCLQCRHRSGMTLHFMHTDTRPCPPPPPVRHSSETYSTKQKPTICKLTKVDQDSAWEHENHVRKDVVKTTRPMPHPQMRELSARLKTPFNLTTRCVSRRGAENSSLSWRPRLSSDPTSSYHPFRLSVHRCVCQRLGLHLAEPTLRLDSTLRPCCLVFLSLQKLFNWVHKYLRPL